MHQARHRALGVLVLGLGCVLLLIAFAGGLPFTSSGGSGVVTARFAEANELDDSTPVRVGGVDVGHVVALRPAAGNTTTVVMALTAPDVRLHADAGAEIRWRTLLGGSMYVDLSPGSASAPALRGSIPLSRTASQVDWDQFNDTFPAWARAEMRSMFAGLSAGLAAPALEGKTLAAFGPGLEMVGRASDALRGQQIGDLPRLVRGSAATASALAASAQSLQDLIAGADRTLAVTSSHNADLARAIALSPPALRSTLATSNRLDATLSAIDALVPRLEPGARELAPTTAVLGPMLARAHSVLVDARPLLAAAPGSLQALARMSGQGTPLIGALRPVLNRLDRDLLPFLETYDPDTRLRLFETIGPTASALSSALSGFDANGPVINFNVSLGPGSVLLPCDVGPGATRVAQCLVPPSKAADLLAGKR